MQKQHILYFVIAFLLIIPKINAQPNTQDGMVNSHVYLIGDGIRIPATCFLINYKDCGYLVTAAHNLGFPKNNQNISFYFKKYFDEGNLYNLAYQKESKVYTHNNDSVDLAVIPFPIDDSYYYHSLAPENFMLSLGDTVVLPGYPFDRLEGRNQARYMAAFYEDREQFTRSEYFVNSYRGVEVMRFWSEHDVEPGFSGAPLILHRNNTVVAVELADGLHPLIEEGHEFNAIFGRAIKFLIEIIESIPKQ